jgi:hypothetical protein
VEATDAAGNAGSASHTWTIAAPRRSPPPRRRTSSAARRTRGGRSWSAANFGNTNFLVRVVNVASSTSRDFSLDWVAVKANYTS